MNQLQGSTSNTPFSFPFSCFSFFSPTVTDVLMNDDVIVSAGEDKQIILWDRDSLDHCNAIKKHESIITSLFLRHNVIISSSLTGICMAKFPLIESGNARVGGPKGVKYTPSKKTLP
jgi:WD40 repeat protein